MKKQLQTNAFARFLMRVSVLQFLLLSGLISIGYADNISAQILEKNLNISIENSNLRAALGKIEKETGARFLYHSQLFSAHDRVTLHVSNQSLDRVLKQILVPLGVTYEAEGNQIILTRNFGNHQSNINIDVAGNDPAISISGIISDEMGAALPGVNILVKGTSVGTTTDTNGKFVLDIPDENAVLVISFIGFLTQEVSVGTQTSFQITLMADVKSLDEVVIVGYGTQRKSDLTGSVGSVKAEEIQERQLPSLNQALAGRIAGVAVNTNSGRPGGQTNVRIRGSSSISASNNPLYVIDGVFLPVGTQTQNSNAIDFINPADIASMEVLKDASATAIYGARGANGVILITTKRGSTGGGKVTYDVQMSVPTIGPKRVHMLNAKEFLAVEDLAWKNASIYDPSQTDVNGNFTGKTDPRLNRTDPLLFDANGNPLYDTDWFKESTPK